MAAKHNDIGTLFFYEFGFYQPENFFKTGGFFIGFQGQGFCLHSFLDFRRRRSRAAGQEDEGMALWLLFYGGAFLPLGGKEVQLGFFCFEPLEGQGCKAFDAYQYFAGFVEQVDIANQSRTIAGGIFRPLGIGPDGSQ